MDNPIEWQDGREAFQRQRFVEEWGMFFELLGLQRMVGRVWAYLLIAPQPAVSAAELADGLQASAGSISTATRLLITTGLARRVRRAGERRDLFELAPGSISRLSGQRLAMMAGAAELADRGAAAFGADPEVRARLEEIRDFYLWMGRELPPLFDRWQVERRAAQAAAMRQGAAL